MTIEERLILGLTEYLIHRNATEGELATSEAIAVTVERETFRGDGVATRRQVDMEHFVIRVVRQDGLADGGSGRVGVTRASWTDLALSPPEVR